MAFKGDQRQDSLYYAAHGACEVLPCSILARTEVLLGYDGVAMTTH